MVSTGDRWYLGPDFYWERSIKGHNKEQEADEPRLLCIFLQVVDTDALLCEGGEQRGPLRARVGRNVNGLEVRRRGEREHEGVAVAVTVDTNASQIGETEREQIARGLEAEEGEVDVARIGAPCENWPDEVGREERIWTEIKRDVTDEGGAGRGRARRLGGRSTGPSRCG